MPTTVVVDAAAVARLTRLITTDGILGPWRDRWLRRWPADGHPIPDPAPTYRHVSGHRMLANRRRPDVRIRAELDETTGDEILVYDEHTKLGELITCPWCVSVYVAAAVVAARRLAPGVWDPVARGLAASLAAGLAAEVTA